MGVWSVSTSLDTNGRGLGEPISTAPWPDRNVTYPGYRPYQPQLAPSHVADDIWTVEGPEVGYRLAGAVLPCPTRMTVVRLASGLWLHSPVAYSPALADRLRPLGPVRFIVAPNTHHHLHLPDWATAFPDAELHLSPDLVGRVPVPADRASALSETAPPGWAGAIDQHLLRLPRFAEAVFLHRASRTLIVTDLLQNFEPSRVARRFARVLLAIGGATGPGGGTSVEIRLAALRYRYRVRDARDATIGWNPARVILAHGRGYEADVAAELRRAFAWAG